MTIKQLIKYFGSQSNVARAFGISRASVSEWYLQNRVPVLRQHEIVSRFPESGLKVSKGAK